MNMKKRMASAGELEIMELAKFYFLNNKFDEAIAELEKVLELNPGNSEAYYNLGLIYEHRNKIDEARQMFEKALDIDNDYRLAREHLNRLIGLSNE